MRRTLLLITALLGIIGGFHVAAGPAPYASAKIYMIDSTGANAKSSAAEIRKNANVVISLTDVAAVDFWYSIPWGENRKLDPNIAKRAQPLIIVIDFYGRTHDNFTGKPETLYFSNDTIYSDDGTYVTSDGIVRKIKALIGGNAAH